MNKKPWDEKLGIWVGIIAGIFGILGISIFGGRALIKNDSKQKEIESSKIISDEEDPQKFDSDENLNQQSGIKDNESIEDNKNNEDETSINTDNELDKENYTDKNSNDNEKIEILETHVPNDVATNVSTINWDSNSDIGIDGNMYNGGLKVVMSNMFTSMGSGASNNIISRITIPLSNSHKNAENKNFSGTLVLEQSMFGSNSSGIIKIIINNQEVFSTGEIDGNTTNSFPFNVNYEGADTIIIEADVTLKGSDFIYGIVNSKE